MNILKILSKISIYSVFYTNKLVASLLKHLNTTQKYFIVTATLLLKYPDTMK